MNLTGDFCLRLFGVVKRMEALFLREVVGFFRAETGKLGRLPH